MLRREERRLHRTFGALLLALVPAASAAQSSCSSDGSNEHAGPSAVDATTIDRDLADDATTNPDAADAGGLLEGGDDASSDPDAANRCGALIAVIDAGPEAGRDADPGCAIALPCGLPLRIFAIGCELYHLEPDDAAPTPIGCRLVEEAGCTTDAATYVEGGYVATECIDCPGGAGRMTAGVVAVKRVRAATGLGAYFARMAHGEAASVFAFERLGRDLESAGAPTSLLSATARAARDEVRHARVMRARAVALGAVPPRPRIRTRTSRRSLATVATENAIEGCLRETFGALVLAHQARAAESAALRRTFDRIARDETRHAALAWTLAGWFSERLDMPSRHRVARARRQALASLERELDARPEQPSPDERALGLPSRATARALLAGLMRSLAWNT